MKKIILLGGALCLLTSFPVNAQTYEAYPQGAVWNRLNNNYQYWHQTRIDQESRNWERAREEARRNDDHDNGNHYAYGKDPKHHKEGWKSQSKHNGKGYGKNHPKYHSQNRPKDPNKYNIHNR